MRLVVPVGSVGAFEGNGDGEAGDGDGVVESSADELGGEGFVSDVELTID